MMQINVTGGELDNRELDAYVARANSRYPVGTVHALDIHIDGDYVDLQYHLTPRRRTGSSTSDRRRRDLILL